MSFYTTLNANPNDEKQGHLLKLAAFFLLFYAFILSLSPAARLGSWEVLYRWNHWIGFVTWLIGTAMIHRLLARHLPDRDPYIFPIIALLSGWGLLSVWRLEPVMGARQTAWLAVCLLVLGFGVRVPNLLPLLRRYKYLWLTGGLLLTGITFLFGTYPGGQGPHLWLGCCGIYFQPSEPLKLLLIVYLSAYLADRLPLTFTLPQLIIPTLILFSAALALLIFQRDLGTGSLFILIYTVMIYLASQRWRVLLLSLLVLVAAGAAGYWLFDVVRVRIDAWLNPWLDPSGRSYQIVQSLLAIASGGMIGRGPGLGSPGVVPVAHSDFIYSSIVEETGLFGAFALLILYILVVGRGFRASIRARNNYQRFLAAGVTTYLVLQTIFIIGGNLRLLPLTGVTLPFVSYGGSSLLTSYIAVLFLLQISSRGEEEPAPLSTAQPYLFISGALIAALIALALLTVWWTSIRRSGLIARLDNPRWGINDRYVPRGMLLDRNDLPIAQTKGAPGQLTRVYAHLPLSTTIGYNSPLYGQAGLEAGLDRQLRGLSNPEEEVLLHDLVAGRPPPGLDVRLSLDLELQQRADKLLADHTGALVLLNAKTGEILVLASHPYFDPTNLENDWSTLIQDPDAPLVNRVTQGQYPTGTSLGPLLLAYLSAKGSLPAISQELTDTTTQDLRNCAQEPPFPRTPGSLVAYGCQQSFLSLAQKIGNDQLEGLMESLGFYERPNLPLAVADPAEKEPIELTNNGQDRLIITPLQMSLAAAAMTNNGLLPTPRLAKSVRDPQGGWTDFPGGTAKDTLLAGGTNEVMSALTQPGAQTWETLAQANSGEKTLTWYLAGTSPGWQETPLALALILEEDAPELARHIGQSVMLDAMK